MLQWKTFLVFCFYFNLPWLPTTSEVVCLYAQFLSQSFRATSSIRNYVSGVKTLHSLLELDIAMFQTTELKLALKGLARLKPHCPKQAAPITPHILRAMAGHMDFSLPEHRVYWALFLFAFFTFARKSNLVSSPKSNNQVRRGDIKVRKSGLLVCFRWSKTNQFGSRKHFVPVVAIPGSILCPVQAYKKMISLVPGGPDSPAFLLPHPDSEPTPVSYPQLQVFLRHIVSRTGLDSSQFSSHSFRRGGATWAFRSRVPGELIKSHGDWASDAYLKYLDLTIDQRLTVAQTMVQSLPP